MQDKAQTFLKSQNSLLNVRKPTFCCIETSTVCVLKCKMCFAWKNKYVSGRKEPGLNEWYHFIDLLADLSDNSVEMNFSGAEPLLDERALILINFSAQKGLPTSLATNGFLIDKEMARKITDSGLNMIIISLDSINKDTHDFLRGVNGSYDKVMQAISYLDSYHSSLKIGIQTIILEKNLDEIIKLVEWVNDNEKINYMSFQAIAQPFYTPVDDNWYNKTECGTLWPKDVKKVHALIDELTRLKRTGYKISNPIPQLEDFKRYFESPRSFLKKTKCNVDFFMNINRLGDVRMCGSTQWIGNIKSDGPKELWYSEEAIRIREQRNNCKANCHLLVNCAYEEE